MKKVVALLLTVVLLMATAVTLIARQPTFTDVAQDYAFEAIERWAENGIIHGRGGGIFDPYATATRAEFSAMMVRILGLQQMAPIITTFTDIPHSQGMNAYVLRAAEAGIFDWGGAFRPNDPITRAEAAVAFTRALGLDASAAGPTHFVDDVMISSADRPAIRAAVDAGIIHGRPAGEGQFSFGPNESILRKHLAVIFNNAFGEDILQWPIPTTQLGDFFNYMTYHTALDGAITLIIIEPRVGVVLPQEYSFLIGGVVHEFYWHPDRGVIGQYRLAVEGAFDLEDISISIG